MDTANFGPWSLIPAIITIILCYKTRKVHWALLFGVIAGAFIFQPSIIGGLQQLGIYLYRSFTNPERLKITFFILMISGILKVLAETGASDKLGHYLGEKLNNKRKSRLSAFFISILLFIDDYANVLISGASISPVFRKNKISTYKLAYFIDVIASVSSIMLISTWAAFEISLIGGATQGLLDMSAVNIFFHALPYHIFTILNIIFVLVIAWFGHWFYHKPMDEEISDITVHKKSARKRDMLIPFGALLGFAIIGMGVGGYLLTAPENRGNFVTVIGNAPSIDVLNLAVILAVILLSFLMIKDQVLSSGEYSNLLWQGIKELMPTGLVIIFAKGLELVTIDLGTGYYIAGFFKTFISPDMIPLFVFIIAASVTVASGFSWSAMVLIMPIAVQMAADGDMQVIFAAIAATISGAILGAQMIPYSDKAIMSSAACKISAIDHIKTQLPQVIFVAVFTVIAYGLIIYLPLTIVYPLILAAMILIYLIVVKVKKRDEKKS